MNKELKTVRGAPVTFAECNKGEYERVATIAAPKLKDIQCIVELNNDLALVYDGNIKLALKERDSKLTVKLTDNDALIFELIVPITEDAFNNISKKLKGFERK